MNAPLVPDPAYFTHDRSMLARQTLLKPVDPEPCSEQAGMHAPECVSEWAMSSMRRGIDCACAAAALTCLGPLMLIVAIVVRLTSKGPAFFQQERMGRNGEAFTLYKFRSMRMAGEDGGSPLTVTGDKRITPVGAFLRRFKLDELPQFWNVLRGDMSLIGPRPKIPHLEVMHMPFRPGITGAATLAFRFEEEMLRDIPADHLERYYNRYVKPRKAEIDWEYMRDATLWTDLRIVWLTAKACFSSVESDWQVTLPEFSPEGAD